MRRRPARRALRFTPARAGTMSGRSVTVLRRAVHPRACGDNTTAPTCEVCSLGSPPRVRGQWCTRRNGNVRHRFTPARAGTISTQRSRQRRWSVHPRACGDNDERERGHGHQGGSPPRVRGQSQTTRCGKDHLRFTPARAGTIGPDSSGCGANSVHPRACGDNSHVQGCNESHGGSPPRVRGQCWRDDTERSNRRFTPARAGTMSYPGTRLASTSVHPRACGDNAPSWIASRRVSGSPPRVRGQYEDQQLMLKSSGSPPRVRGQ